MTTDIRIRTGGGGSQAQRDLEATVKGRTVVAVESHQAQPGPGYGEWHRLVFDDGTALVINLPFQIFALGYR